MDVTSRGNKFSGARVTEAELGNLLEIFKTDILSTLSSQLDVFQAKKKEKSNLELSIFCSKCRMKHPV